MCALSSPAVRPVAGVVPRRAATATSDATERALGTKKRPRAAPAARDSSSACLTKTTMIRNRNSVVTTAAGEMPSQELLQKRQASELGALRGLLMKAELVVSQRGAGACKGGGAPAAGKKERFLASNQRTKPTQEDVNVPSLKRRKTSMRLDKVVAEESKDDKVVAEESRDEKVAEESKDDKVAEESKGEVVREQKDGEYADISGGLSCIIETGSSRDYTKVVQQSGEAKTKVQDAQRAAPKDVDMRGLLYRANLRRQLLEMERAALPDQSIDPRYLQAAAAAARAHAAARARATRR